MSKKSNPTNSIQSGLYRAQREAEWAKSKIDPVKEAEERLALAVAAAKNAQAELEQLKRSAEEAARKAAASRKAALCAKSAPAKKVGDNVTAEIRDGKLILTIDLNAPVGDSKSGKFMALGNTHGFCELPNGIEGNIWVGLRK